ncbi:RHS repeat-associated core domain-containing protein [Lentzea sp. NPDC006480]|uniref:RHS repeat-associated core domain-containing protein n=1 Tax=Lentzea sp. NPDC006480 TaxID=3157176 RepID=UPI00339E17E9
MKRLLARLLPAVLTASVVSVTVVSAALAGQPSVGLPTTPSTPVTEQKMGSRDQDQASKEALRGNQPGGTSPDGGGNNRATPLAPSATWDVSAQTGDFSWSYPLRVPPAPGGLEPKLALSYTSSSVDGRTSATNNQASWVGDGWSLGVGFVERTYRPCADDTTGGTTPPKEVGDLCWRSDNATASYGGSSSELVRDDQSGEWRARSDDGSRIERLTGKDNGDDDGESWRITTVDGTQYFFGSRKDAQSTWTVPVFGDDAGEPCHQATFAASHCVQAWRWNLDKVVDRNGNSIVYNYETETNNYGLNNTDTAVPYVRGGTLKSAEYGLRDGSDQHATGLVEFATADRCVPDSECTPDKLDNWPDVTWKDKCDGPKCDAEHRAPTFWDSRRLDKITTKVWNGTGYADVERWQLNQEFPKTGDGEKPALWLRGITHTGLAGTPIDLPPVTFEGTKMPNRVAKVDGIGPLLRYRVTAIVSEAGGVTTVKYHAPDCADNALPANPESNTQRCFPQWWAKKDQSERLDYFHKYVVDQVTSSDRISANTEQVTSYEYIGGAGWAYDRSEFTKDDKRTWNDFRGFSDVKIRKGKPDDPAGPVTMTEKYFYRGMNGDKLPNNGVRPPVEVTDSEGGTRLDEEWLRGQEYESQVHDGEGDGILEKTISTPYVHGPTATRGTIKAYQIRQGVVSGYTLLAAGGWRKTRSEQSYDDNGLLTSASDLGDISVATDDRCNRTTYSQNTGKWLLNPVARTEVLAVACTATPSFPKDAISDTITAYDGKAFGQAPDAGNPTRVEDLDQRPATKPVYTLKSTATYDAHGRPTGTGDALGRVTTTKYVPEAGGPTRQTVTTNPAGHVTTTTLEPFHGQETISVDANDRKTETSYDALGNKTEVWLPNRDKATGVRGNYRYSYTYHNDAPTVVSETRIGPNGNYLTVNNLYDGLLRLRQTQSPANGGGRLIVDTRYDSQNRAFKTTMPYFNDQAVDGTLWVAGDVDIAQQTVLEHDGAGREQAKITKAGATEKWRTTTQYGGDRVHVVPPQGGTPTTAINDARGNAVELRQYHGAVLTSEFDSTKYTYSTAGRRESVTDAAGSVWRYGYDLHGRKTSVVSPDKGTSTINYDVAGQVKSTTDGRGTTLTFDFDVLGRKSKVASGATTLVEWKYDTAPFGKGLDASSTRYLNGAAYKSTTVGYNALNQPLGVEVSIPQTEQTLAGTYTSYAKYNLDGSLSSHTYAAAGSLPAEAVQFSYNDLGQILTTSGGYNGRTDHLVTDTQYTKYGELARTQLGDTGKRVWLSRYYDTNTRQLTRSIVDAEVANPMQSDTNYDYDAFGNIKSIVDKPTGQPVDRQCFEYDYLQRLTQAWTPSSGCDTNPTTGALSGPAPYWQSFTYDKSGNRLTETQHAAAGDTVRTSVFPPAGGAHNIKSVETKAPSGTKTDSFDYDAVGNTTARNLSSGAQKLDWDAEGHLTKVTEGASTTEFLYNAGDQRLLRKDPTGTTLYLDGQEVRLVKGNGKIETSRYYKQGEQTVAMRDAGGLTWIASDPQNTANIAVKSSDLSVLHRRQSPFGAPRGEAAAFPGERGFLGGTIDAMAGLVQLGARAYDAALGRFISVDPVADTENPQQLNGYTYADNSPLTKFDPDGMAWKWLHTILSGGAAILGLATLFTPVGGFAFAICLGLSLVMNVADATIGGVEHNSTAIWLSAAAGLTGVVGAAYKVAGAAMRLTEAAEAGVKATETSLTLTAGTVAGVGVVKDFQHATEHELAEARKKEKEIREAVRSEPTDDECIPKVTPNGQNLCNFRTPPDPLLASFCNGPNAMPKQCQKLVESRSKVRVSLGPNKDRRGGPAQPPRSPVNNPKQIWDRSNSGTADDRINQGTTGRSWS